MAHRVGRRLRPHQVLPPSEPYVILAFIVLTYAETKGVTLRMDRLENRLDGFEKRFGHHLEKHP